MGPEKPVVHDAEVGQAGEGGEDSGEGGVKQVVPQIQFAELLQPAEGVREGPRELIPV